MRSLLVVVVGGVVSIAVPLALARGLSGVALLASVSTPVTGGVHVVLGAFAVHLARRQFAPFVLGYVLCQVGILYASWSGVASVGWQNMDTAVALAGPAGLFGLLAGGVGWSWLRAKRLSLGAE